MGLLATQGSMAAGICCQYRLTKEIIKESFRRAQQDRRRRIVLAGIICATRFKFFTERGECAAAACVNGCGQQETVAHMIECHRLCLPEDVETAEEWIRFLGKLASRAAWTSGTRPRRLEITDPSQEGQVDEISLEIEPDEERNLPQSEEDVEMAPEFDG